MGVDDSHYARRYAARGALAGLIVGTALAGWAAFAGRVPGAWGALAPLLVGAALGFPFSVLAYGAVSFVAAGAPLAVLPVTLGWACWGFVAGAFRDGAARDRRRRSGPAA
jgi:hypothetical protein